MDDSLLVGFGKPDGDLVRESDALFDRQTGGCR